MARGLGKLIFTKDWSKMNPPDFPTHEDNEATVRADIQLLYNEIRDYLNNILHPAVNTITAEEVEFTPSTVIPADNIQDAIENVQEQIVDVSQGEVPNGSITAEKLAAGAAGFTDVTNQLTFTVLNNNAPVTTNNLKFHYSAALGMMFITGMITMQKTESKFYDIRYSITGPFNFGTDDFSGLQLFSSIGEPTGFLFCSPNSMTLEIDFGHVEDSDLSSLDTVFTRASAWLFCTEVSS